MKPKELKRRYKNGETDFRGKIFKWGDFSGQYLQEAIFRGSDFSHADLSNANLKRADLRECFLWETNLNNTNLFGADLRDAKLGYSSWFLSCNNARMLINKRIFCRFAAHLCTMIVDDKECKKAQRSLLKLAKQSCDWEYLMATISKEREGV